MSINVNAREDCCYLIFSVTLLATTIVAVILLKYQSYDIQDESAADHLGFLADFLDICHLNHYSHLLWLLLENLANHVLVLVLIININAI